MIITTFIARNGLIHCHKRNNVTVYVICSILFAEDMFRRIESTGISFPKNINYD